MLSLFFNQKEFMMKTLIKVMAVVFCLNLSACNYGIFDWNNQNIDKTIGYKKLNSCVSSQQNIARTALGDNYSKAIDDDILYKCLDKSSYKFKSDPKYK